MSKHTPSPLTVKKSEEADCAFEVMHDEYFVATTHDGVDGLRNAEANAILFSAAPDLLEALETLFNAVDSAIELTPDVMRKAQDAIKKARGES
jgi:hypothetical protein